MPSEFTALFDLVISQGAVHSDLIADIQSRVLAAYRDKFPKGPIDTVVLVDSLTGKVRLLSGDRDITPPKFASEAESLARQVLISHLSSTPATPSPSAGPAPAPRPGIGGPIPAILANLFFWGYNLYFLLFGIITFLYYLQSGRSAIQSMGLLRLFLSAVLLATPVLSAAIALKNRLFRSPGALLRLFFLLEVPLAAACLVPLGLVTQTTAFVTFLILGLLSLPVIFYLYQSPQQLSHPLKLALLFVQKLALTLTAYLVFLYSFYLPIIVGELAKSLFDYPVGRFISGMSSQQPYPPPFPDIPSLLMGITILLLVSVVLLVPFLILMVLWRAFRSTYQSARPSPALLAVYSFVIISLGLASAYQPSGTRLLASLAKISTVTTFAEKENLAIELVPHKDQLKGLIGDLQSFHYKYLFTKSDTSLASAYRRVFGLGKVPSDLVQKAFLAAAYPFVFQGESTSSYLLGQNYQYVFGETYYQTTPAPTPLPAKNVLLSSRKVSSTPSSDGQYATITIDEEYENQTFSQQEVIYEFTLPDGSVVTDLKLGPDLEFPGILAPKGAAQRTYEAQLQVRRDPALLEVTGPRQYRLRVFPVPAKNDQTTLKGRRQRVAFTYQAPATPNGFALPEITRQSNVFSSSATRFLGVGDKDKYLPATAPLAVVKDPTSPSRLKVGIFYDVSPREKTTPSIFDVSPDFFSQNEVTLHKYNELQSDPQPATDGIFEKIVHFGNPGNLNLLSSPVRYDLVLLVPGSKAVFDSLPFSPPSRVYIVHPGPVPPYSLKFTSQLLQTGGGVATSVSDALGQYSKSAPVPASPPNLTPVTGALAPVRNQALYRSYLTSIPSEVSGDITQLDKLHAFAVSAGIATPYSSFLALVNETQIKQLQQQSQDWNRFQDQALRENATFPQPMPITRDFFRGPAPSLPLFGASLNQLELSPAGGIGGGGGTFGALGAPAMYADGGGGSSLFLPGFGLFTIVSGAIMVLGLAVYLLRLLRHKP